MSTDRDVARWRENRQEEVDSASQYRAMASSEASGAVADIYRKLAAVEEKHAAFWEERLKSAGLDPGPRKPTFRARALGWIARRFGATMILPTVAASEYSQRNNYMTHPETTGTRMTE
ncbi:MAG TPA: hypothetical protein VGL13_03185, partial [Polyangiaceae bacterium]